MARIIVNGSVPSIAATFRSTATITGISNAAAAVASLGAGHGTVVGDFVEIVSSGWSRLVGRVFRVSNVATNDVTLEGCDTTSTATFPAGQGAGTLRAVLTWVQKAMDWSSSTLKATSIGVWLVGKRNCSGLSMY